MTARFFDHVAATLASIESDGLSKQEREIASAQGGHIRVQTATERHVMLNLCANNYLGLANNPEIVAAAKRGMDEFGFGMASVRFICGTQTLHRQLERRIADYLGMQDAILFAACYDANGGVFEALFGPEDAVISDALNHASIIDGIRLCKAKRYRYANGDMGELETSLRRADAEGARFRIVVTDGVFSMDGHVANLGAICELADRYDALVMVDDSHATGHLGHGGRGTPSLTGTAGRVNIVTGTFGKSLGGAMGGFVSASQPVVDLLRQRARPYLFSNSLAPGVVAGTLKAIDIAEHSDERRAILAQHSTRFRAALMEAGFDLLPGETPIIPVMLHDARKSQEMARLLCERGVHVAAFSYPVVPQGKARIRTQMSAGLSSKEVEFAIEAFIAAGTELGIV